MRIRVTIEITRTPPRPVDLDGPGRVDLDAYVENNRPSTHPELQTGLARQGIGFARARHPDPAWATGDDPEWGHG